ncbi:hypothetical protein ACRE_000210 [Hapsidospora chrysogenum ATCC 11550]|uniref:Uncharacterized protein n=1 Tax=Hapsidospora chrysogenum (strain ATCC 11550 / CBS 779.69 / DSM 880 / IAM 14645 / JCM 23072 / IMI 49137) TaxID=857340 RepID=A0A086THJ6_HAPC1|nr:hypothetical protein ACRE_000210 [Hapsidospora chrysogenum ATCC 11550]
MARQPPQSDHNMTEPARGDSHAHALLLLGRQRSSQLRSVVECRVRNRPAGQSRSRGRTRVAGPNSASMPVGCEGRQLMQVVGGSETNRRRGN